jgi:U3 small nucleolar RNA-associated protein 4
MALEPTVDQLISGNERSGCAANGHANHNGYTDSDLSNVDDGDNSDDEDDSAKTSSSYHVDEFPRLALACEKGYVRLYTVPESGALTYYRSLPTVSGMPCISFVSLFCSYFQLFGDYFCASLQEKF